MSNKQGSGMTWLEMFGFIFAVLIPLVGFIIGIVVTFTASPGRSNNGPWIIVASLLAALFWLAITS